MACTGHEPAGFDISKLHTSFSDSVPKQRASLPFSEKPGNETGHQEQVTASQGIGANQAKHGVGRLGHKEERISFAVIFEEIIQSCSSSRLCQNFPALLSRFNCAQEST